MFKQHGKYFFFFNNYIYVCMYVIIIRIKIIIIKRKYNNIYFLQISTLSL